MVPAATDKKCRARTSGRGASGAATRVGPGRLEGWARHVSWPSAEFRSRSRGQRLLCKLILAGDDLCVMRGDLTDRQWARLEPLLPAGLKQGWPRTWTRRQLIDGISWRTRAGTPWRDVPERYGPWDRVHDLFRRWQRDGTWKRILEELQAQDEAGGADHLGRERGLDRLPCPSARCRRP
ncbi:transposase [Streptomyces sp. NPDC060035]|uniref:transposase n=1 Tax=Streptomyces sp. NPDC060035 TaxID=3347044 RepID=UPI0036B3D6E1